MIKKLFTALRNKQRQLHDTKDKLHKTQITLHSAIRESRSYMESLADEMQRNHSLSKEIFQLKKTNELLKSHTHSMQANFDKRIRKLLKN